MSRNPVHALIPPKTASYLSVQLSETFFARPTSGRYRFTKAFQ
jgi:hypothetical protein